MSQAEVERFLGRIITDSKFRIRSRNCLDRACFSNGFSLSTAEKALLQHIDYSLIELIGESIDDSLRRT